MRRPLPVPRTPAILALLVATSLLVGACGEDEAPASPSSSGSSSSSGPSAAAGDDGGDDAATPPAFCDLITAEQIGEVVGATVTTEVGPFDACEFAQEDLRALSGMLGSIPIDVGNGGFPAVRSGAKSALTNGVDHPIDGLGEEAFVATGTIGGGESLQAGGAVAVGGLAYTVNLSGTPETSEDEIVRIAEGLLKLMVGAAG